MGRDGELNMADAYVFGGDDGISSPESAFNGQKLQIGMNVRF